MKKTIELGITLIILSVAITGCGAKTFNLKDNELLSVKGQSGVYRPMVYVQDILYGETADVVGVLPENAVSIGVIEKTVPQNEPMVRENFTSNLLPIGSQVYCDEADLNIVYVLLPLDSKVQYSVYEGIDCVYQ